ncbi:MAG TPA: FUSC family protein [Candidatus Baltobacteraceae bacterium]|nr:FUSC family protein [Candidatus Baltobacteraceae bacterium]
MQPALRAAVDRLIASDPGLLRLYQALRTTLAVMLASVILGQAAGAMHYSINVVLMGAIVAMQVSLAVNDPSARNTTLLTPIPAAIGILLGALVSARGLLADVMFLVVLFVAVAIRHYGQRWNAFGVVAMMAYFLALFFGATTQQLPVLVFAAVAGAAASFLVRFVLLPDRPEGIARGMVGALRARIRLVAEIVRGMLSARESDTATERRLEAAVRRVNETALAIEGRLSDDATEQMRIIFDAELAAEALAAAGLRMRRDSGERPRAAQVAISALLHGSLARAKRVAQRLRDDPNASAHAAELASAIDDVADAIVRLRAIGGALQLGGGGGGAAWQQQPALRQAVQVTLAAAASITVGEALSPSRWFWAVLAAFFVFSGTASSGETAARAWARVVGTALGVVLGIVAGHFARNAPAADVAAAFVCLFLGVYSLRVSYGLMIFFITAMLAMLYALLGRLSDGLMFIRLAETIVGAFFGGLSATLLFPTRTRDVVRERARAALDAAREAVHAGIARLLDPASEREPLDAARELDDRVHDFVLRAKPLVSGNRFVRGSDELRRWMVALTSAGYYARTLARVADRSREAPTQLASVPLRRLDAAIAANIDAAAEHPAEFGDAPIRDTTPLLEALRRAERAQDGETASVLEAASHLLEHLDRAVARLTNDTERSAPGPRPASRESTSVDRGA